MLKFDEEKILKSINGALAMRPKIEAVADELYDRGFDAIFYMGIGGTYASGIMVVDSVEGKSKLPIYVMQAARYIAHGTHASGQFAAGLCGMLALFGLFCLRLFRHRF